MWFVGFFHLVGLVAVSEPVMEIIPKLLEYIHITIILPSWAIFVIYSSPFRGQLLRFLYAVKVSALHLVVALA